MGHMVYLPTWKVDFYGKCRQIYHTWILSVYTVGFENRYSFIAVHRSEVSLPKFDVAPEAWWLEYDRFLVGPRLFSGAFALSFREGFFHHIIQPHLGKDPHRVYPP